MVPRSVGLMPPTVGAFVARDPLPWLALAGRLPRL